MFTCTFSVFLFFFRKSLRTFQELLAAMFISSPGFPQIKYLLRYNHKPNAHISTNKSRRKLELQTLQVS